MKRKIHINFSDFWHPDTLEAKLNNPLYKLLSERFDLVICDNPDFLLFSSFGVNFIRYSGVRIFYTGENVRPNYSLCDWSFGFDYSDDPRHFRLPYYAIWDTSPLLQTYDTEALIARKKRFCAFVYSNAKAKMRIQFLDKLSRYKTVDCGGRVRNNIGSLVSDKVAFLRDYKFNIAFENESYPGYTTEKLPESFIGNTVPIYWGNPLIDKEFNTSAFINAHEFRNLDQVVEFVVEMDRNDQLYQQYLASPAFINGNANEFVDKNRILDRFEQIFESSEAIPCAQTLAGRIASLMREPRRYRHQVKKILQSIHINKRFHSSK